MSTKKLQYLLGFSLTSHMIFRCYAFRRAALGRHAWLVVPAAGLGWHSQRQQPPSHTLIPKRPPIIVFSPSEHRLSLIGRVWECILTAKRFIYLVFLFLPVLVSSPLLLVGKPLSGNRWGAVWWYGLLVSRMEAAGPTFIKVGNLFYSSTHLIQIVISWLNGPLPGRTSFLLCCVNASVLSTLVESLTLSSTQKPLSNPYSNDRLILSSNPLIPTPWGQVPLPRYSHSISS
jgi:hypothetical protein